MVGRVASRSDAASQGSVHTWLRSLRTRFRHGERFAGWNSRSSSMHYSSINFQHWLSMKVESVKFRENMNSVVVFRVRACIAIDSFTSLPTNPRERCLEMCIFVCDAVHGDTKLLSFHHNRLTRRSIHVHVRHGSGRKVCAGKRRGEGHLGFVHPRKIQFFSS